PKITITGSGTVDLATDELNIILKPARKKASVFSFQNPVHIGGTLQNPKRTTLGKAKTVGKIGLVVLQPYFLLFTASLGTGETNPCVAALSGEDTGSAGAEKRKPLELGLVGELLHEIEKPVEESDETVEATRGSEQ
ncbi:MAG: hypothetical protein ACE5LB_17860, partial [Acidiferrobacterales bacterium]